MQIKAQMMSRMELLGTLMVAQAKAAQGDPIARAAVLIHGHAEAMHAAMQETEARLLALSTWRGLAGLAWTLCKRDGARLLARVRGQR